MSVSCQSERTEALVMVSGVRPRRISTKSSMRRVLGIWVFGGPSQPMNMCSSESSDLRDDAAERFRGSARRY